MGHHLNRLDEPVFIAVSNLCLLSLAFIIDLRVVLSAPRRTEYIQNLLTGFPFSIGALDFFNDPGYEVFFEGDEWWRGGFWRVSGPVNNFAVCSKD